MWLFTVHGFCSVVAQPGHPGMMMVRSRSMRHLYNLKERARRAGLETIGHADIVEQPLSDYRYRLIVPQDEVAALAATLIEDTTWSNFKDAAAQHGAERVYLDTLHGIWHAVYTAARRVRRS